MNLSTSLVLWKPFLSRELQNLLPAAAPWAGRRCVLEKVIFELQQQQHNFTWGENDLRAISLFNIFQDKQPLLLLPGLLLLLHISCIAAPLFGEEQAVAMDLLKPGWLCGGSWRERLASRVLGRHGGGHGRWQRHCGGRGGRLLGLPGAQQQDDHHQDLGVIQLLVG